MKIRLGLVGLAMLGSVYESEATIISYSFFTTNGASAGTNLVIGTPYMMAVTLDTTSPTNLNDGVHWVSWVLGMPSGPNYTNIINFTGGSLPNVTLNTVLDDFFTPPNTATTPGYPFYNYVSTNIDGAYGYYTKLNQRVVDDLHGGVTNNYGALGWYYFTPIATATNRSFNPWPSNGGGGDTSGNRLSFTVDRPYFNIVSIPEPSTVGIMTLIGCGIFAWRRLRSWRE
jgi:hypothetical protein